MGRVGRAPCYPGARGFFFGVSRGGPREADAPRRSFDWSLSSGVLPMLAAAKLLQPARSGVRGQPRCLSPVGRAAVGPLLFGFRTTLDLELVCWDELGWVESRGSSRRPRVTHVEIGRHPRQHGHRHQPIRLECHRFYPRGSTPCQLAEGARRCTPQICPCARNGDSRTGAAGPGIPGDWISFGWKSADPASPTFARLPFPGFIVP